MIRHIANTYTRVWFRSVLSKLSWGWWFEKPSCLLWRHCIEHCFVNQVIIEWRQQFYCYPFDDVVFKMKVRQFLKVWSASSINFSLASYHFTWISKEHRFMGLLLKRTQVCWLDLNISVLNEPAHIYAEWQNTTYTLEQRSCWGCIFAPLCPSVRPSLYLSVLTPLPRIVLGTVGHFVIVLFMWLALNDFVNCLYLSYVS